MINLILFLCPPWLRKLRPQNWWNAIPTLSDISTGDLFRHEMGNTPLGKQAKAFMAAGLAPHEVTIGMLRNKVEAHPEAQGFIFDGAPRTIPQASALDALLGSMGRPRILQLISLDVDEEEIVCILKLPPKVAAPTTINRISSATG